MSGSYVWFYMPLALVTSKIPMEFESIGNVIFGRCLSKINSIAILLRLYKKDPYLRMFRNFPGYPNVICALTELTIFEQNSALSRTFYVDLINGARKLVEYHPVLDSESVRERLERSNVVQLIRYLQSVVMNELGTTENAASTIEKSPIDDISEKIAQLKMQIDAREQLRCDAIEEHNQQKRKLILESNAVIRERCIESERKLELLKSTFREMLTMAKKENQQIDEELTNAVLSTQTQIELLRNSIKVKQQHLMAAIERYDNNVGKRKLELMTKKERLDVEKQEFDDWMEDFLEKETIYNALIEKMDREHAVRLDLFVKHRAARIIQRKFREMKHLQRLAAERARKKSAKNKKKKKK